MAGKAIINTVISLQPEIWKRLLKICKGDRVGSAYLFSGPPGCGKEGLAIAFCVCMIFLKCCFKKTLRDVYTVKKEMKK